MTQYPRYKDSGNEWLGKVPEHWELKPLKHLGVIVLGKMLTSDDKGGYHQRFYLRAQNIEWERVNTDDIKEMWFSDGELLDYRLRQNDILVSEGGEVGRAALWRNEISECYIQNSVHKVTILNGGSPVYYLFHFENYGKQGYFEAIVNRVSIAHLTREKLKDVKFLSPPPKEQKSISSFLDRKIRQLDALIEKKRRMIELLKEERVAIINHAVTKGLDPNAKMKDSGIEWLGEIPKTWEVIKTKYIFKLSVENAPGNNDFELLSLYTDIGVKPRKELEERGNRATTTDGYLIVHKGDIVVNKLLAWMGAIGCSDYEGVTSPAYDVLAKIKPLNSMYYHHLFRCGVYLPEFKRRSRGIMDMRLRLYFDEFGQIPLPYPPAMEQDEIVNYLSSKTNQINCLIGKEQNILDLLQEYRTALISEVVTGKIDVRGET